MLHRQDLNHTQKHALHQFESTGHQILYGPRQSGKTTVLQWIIATCPAKFKILLVGLYAMNQTFLDKMKEGEEQFGNMNVHLVFPVTLDKFTEMYAEPGRPQLKEFDVVVFDGGILHQHREFMTASAYCDEECLAVFGKVNTTQFDALPPKE